MAAGSTIVSLRRVYAALPSSLPLVLTSAIFAGSCRESGANNFAMALTMVANASISAGDQLIT